MSRALQERVRQLEDKVRRLQGGEIPADSLTIGTGTGQPVRIFGRTGPPGGVVPGEVDDDKTLMTHPFIEFTPNPLGGDGSAILTPGAEIRVSHDGRRGLPILGGIVDPAIIATTHDVDSLTHHVQQMTKTYGTVALAWSYAAASSAGLGVAVTTGSWADIGDEGGGLVIPGGSVPFPSTAVHTLIAYASLSAVTGQIRIQDQDSASTLATITGIGAAGFATTTSFTLPSANTRYRLECTIDSGSGTCTIWAVNWWVVY